MRVLRTYIRGFDVSASCLPSSSHIQSQRRWLGQAPSGRKIDSVDAAWDEAKKLFYKPSMGYSEFAKRVDALRIFAFWAMITGLSIDLIINPPQSAYWSKWNVLKMPSRLMDKFGHKSKQDVMSNAVELDQDHLTEAVREYHRVCNV
ncbi:hypothetical protein BBOV_II006550 [Babesia bovis T2Bo]|uniref:hypothetical protein n=1 Tax=Babesia bovis T2Bo TaxID=484906 RepID=UPI001C35ADDD|nr:hypothetical protein BBOV_II006550 [Babesia bovis T2Bo]EDO06605.2 hypothetical protein BBOV_II006550 [Babesia bovis T2Bo]